MLSRLLFTSFHLSQHVMFIFRRAAERRGQVDLFHSGSTFSDFVSFQPFTCSDKSIGERMFACQLFSMHQNPVIQEIQFGFKSNIRLTETLGLRLPDEPKVEGRNRWWAVEEFSPSL
ncbi:hypothetical protein CSKR_107985 [Clonorchis sinensis]|uniref:Uncharacterized protein n=1 Tax=Clonorchis sinensis TaxID=79923 RepID=A0A419QAB7_CLOSI|nr:hypothetical protein CSKR_107985 [Clonorchis sinensis]